MIYLTGYSDYLTGFHEPLSPPDKCHSSLKNVLCNHFVTQCKFYDLISKLESSGPGYSDLQGVGLLGRLRP